MMPVPYLPVFVTALCRGLPGVWKSRHRLLLCWLIVMHARLPGRKTLADLARWTPAEGTSWRWRRLLQAASWDVHGLVAWWAQRALNTVPPPEDGVSPWTGDGSDKPQRGTTNPLTQTGRKSEPPPWCFGMRCARLMVRWDVVRFPVALRLRRPTSPPQ
jgi:hypothetical protein